MAVVITILLAASSPAVSNKIAHRLEIKYPEMHAPPIGTKYIAVLSGGGHRETDRSPNVILSSNQLTRLVEAVRLWKLTPDAMFITTGAKIGGKFTLADGMAEIAQWLGVPNEKIIRLNMPRDTMSEIDEIAKVVRSETVVITSSAYHLPRIAMLASRHELNYNLAPSDWLGGKGVWWTLNTHSVYRVDQIIHEYVGMLWYRLRWSLE